MSFSGKCPACKESIEIHADNIVSNKFDCPKCSTSLNVCKNPILDCTNFTKGNYCAKCKTKLVGVAFGAITGINIGL